MGEIKKNKRKSGIPKIKTKKIKETRTVNLNSNRQLNSLIHFHKPLLLLYSSVHL